MALSERVQTLLKTRTIGSPLKRMYSDYVSGYTQRQLISFDRLDLPGLRTVKEATIDAETQIEGTGALRWTLTEETNGLKQMCWADGKQFDLCVTDRKKTTLKLWLFIDSTDGIVCDHDAIYGAQGGQATFFFRVLDQNGGQYCWNHTLTGDGWHEIELSFNIHNGYSPDFDMHHITGFYMMFNGHVGTTIELDDLRVVEYQTDYVPSPAPDGGRLITESEYDALDGAIVQEWYGASFDTTDKMNGKSSLRCIGDATVCDFRTNVTNLNIPITHAEDVLVVWAKIKDLDTVNSIFIELNEVQDVHEYEISIPRAKFAHYGMKESNTWSKLVIPLSDMRRNLRPAQFGDGETITLRNFRYVLTANGDATYDSHIDLVYITTKTALSM
ncbi:MAG: hypothetical protein E7605_08890 [Ruminococcaceae bacterium]|nr:hypothetical protein [Oscillospiraceae bacterium]